MYQIFKYSFIAGILWAFKDDAQKAVRERREAEMEERMREVVRDEMNSVNAQ